MINKYIGLDIDGVLANFNKTFLDMAKELGITDGLPDSPGNWIDAGDSFYRVWDLVKDDEFFWISIEAFHETTLKFPPTVYVTARSIPSRITTLWLKINHFPIAPVITVGFDNAKSAAIKQFQEENNLILDWFVDDRADVYKELTVAGIPCLLLDRIYNRDTDVGLNRITNVNEALFFTKPVVASPASTKK